MSACTITLENMEFKAYHGCYAMEKVVGNRFHVTLRVTADVSEAVLQDDISATLNYLSLYEVVRQQMAMPSNILENVAHRIIEAIYSGFDKVIDVNVTVSKLAPPLGGKMDRVSVTMSK